ncbi:hypothetical protein WA026_005526 [Henosepilachna vigintioctopunctata]|uniref:Uncharacterized protein n=1 Tax=Henosepilachna vigintioctopunctata TaxID=420089 RepID=A0AAW1TT14_9CUCU
MKIIHSLVFFLLILMLRKTIGGAIKAPLHIITLEDVTSAEREELKAIGEQYERTKRSGSGSPDLLSSLKYILASGAKAKLTLLGRASAAASSSIASSSSSSKSYSDHEYVYHHPPEHPKSDPWSSKKSVLNTLLQAVKAIKGGVLALKGQLIKGGGYLLVGGGNLVKSKGEAISNLGKKIARNAFRDIHPDHSSEVHEDVSYGHYHSIGTKYGPPSEPIHVDHFHHDFHDPYPDKTPGPQSGILILKRAPSGKEPHSLHGSETNIASVASVEPEPQFGNIVGKLLSAASSLNPDSPAPFTNYKQPYPQPIQYTADEDVHSNDSDQHDHGHVSNYEYIDPYF